MFRALLIALCFLSIKCQAATVTESFLQTAGNTCGSGFTYEVQGELDAVVMKRLRVGGLSGTGKIKSTQAKELLQQFKAQEKRQVYKDYLDCLIKVITIAATTSSLPEKDVVLDSPVVVSNLQTIRRGQRFVMKIGDSYAIKNHAIIFTLKKIKTNNSGPYFSFSWSNSETAASKKSFASQADLITIDKGCNLVPYKIDYENELVSILSNC